MNAAQIPVGWGAPWYLQAAHLGSGSGSMRRVDDRRAVVLLSPLVHELHVADFNSIPIRRINGFPYPTVGSEHLLWVKQYFDPEYFDMDFIRSIWHGEPPQPERPPEFWIEMMTDHAGIKL